MANKIASYEQELSKPVNLRKITIPIMLLGQYGKEEFI